MSPRAAVLAVDHGTKKTGFASTDALRTAEWPLDCWHGPGDSAELLHHIAELVKERDARTVIVGLPLNMDLSEGPQAAIVRAFIDSLRSHLADTTILPWDERLTTRSAEDLLHEVGFHGAKLKSRRDSWSALVLLRDWLETGEPT